MNSGILSQDFRRNNYFFQKFKKKTFICICSIISNNTSKKLLHSIKYRKLFLVILEELLLKEEIVKLSEHTNKVTSIINLNEDEIASGSEDGSIKIWNVFSGVCLKSLDCTKSYASCLLMVSKILICGGYNDWTIRIWNVKESRCINTIRKHFGKITCLLLCNEETVISAGGETIKLLNIFLGTCLKTFFGHESQVIGLNLLDEKFLVSLCESNLFIIWNLESLKKIKEESCLTTASFCVNTFLVIDSKRIAFAGTNRKIFVCFHDGFSKETELFGHSDAINSLYLHKKHYLLSCSDDKTIKLWKLNNHTCLETFTGHTYPVLCAIIIRDSIILSGGKDLIIRGWMISFSLS